MHDTQQTARQRFHALYGPGPVVIPVLHPISTVATRKFLATVIEVGCAGLFAINQGGFISTLDGLLDMADDLATMAPGLPIGINGLGYEADSVALAAADESVSAVWSDTPFKEASGAVQFHPVAFKGQPQPDDLEQAVHAARAVSTVITTSGPGTGVAANLDKIRKIREYAGDHPVAVASGVTPENAAEYFEHVDAVLVATGIEKRFGILDTVKLRALVDISRSFQSRRVFSD